MILDHQRPPDTVRVAHRPTVETSSGWKAAPQDRLRIRHAPLYKAAERPGGTIVQSMQPSARSRVVIHAMSLVNKTVRMTEAEWEWIAREAHEAGVSVSDYMRQASLVRATIDRARRAPEDVARLASAYEAGHAVIDYVENSDYLVSRGRAGEQRFR